MEPDDLRRVPQSVLYGFKAFKIEETAKDIMKNVEALGGHLNAYQDYYKTRQCTLDDGQSLQRRLKRTWKIDRMCFG